MERLFWQNNRNIKNVGATFMAPDNTGSMNRTPTDCTVETVPTNTFGKMDKNKYIGRR
jgi:hypothetical protein